MEQRTDSTEERQGYVLQGFSRTEAAFGLFWLGLAAFISVFLEVMYLGTWIAGVPVPYTIVIAFGFNLVLNKTAALWSRRTVVQLLPLFVWLAGFFLFTLWSGVAGDQLLLNSFRSIALLLAGVAGGVFHLLRAR